MVDRATGALTIYTQGAVGTAEPERSDLPLDPRAARVHPPRVRAGRVRRAPDGGRDRRHLAATSTRHARRPGRFVPFAARLPSVGMADRWYPGPDLAPLSRRLELPHRRARRRSAGAGRRPARLPAARAASARRAVSASEPPAAGWSTPGSRPTTSRRAGIPVPENYSAPVVHRRSQEDIERPPPGVPARRHPVHDLLVRAVVGPDAQHQDAHRQGRGQRVPRLRLGARSARHDGDASVAPGPARTRSDPANLPPITDRSPADAGAGEQPRQRLERPRERPDRRVRADRPDARSRATTPTTTSCRPALGYELTVPISMANDYNGYIATYREYQRGDHYRKALTGWGPHSSDYMATRLVTIGAPAERPGARAAARPGRGDRAAAEGRRGPWRSTTRAPQAARRRRPPRPAAYEAPLPDDGGDAEARSSSPQDVERFAAAFFTWNGGSNYTDNPHVQVQRRAAARWERLRRQSGEMPVTLEFPQRPRRAELPERRAASGAGRRTSRRSSRASTRARARWRRPPGDVPLRGRRPAPRGRRGRAVRPRVARVRGRGRGAASPSRTCASTPDGRVSFRGRPARTRAHAAARQAEIGPIDYPDSYASPARVHRRSDRLARPGRAGRPGAARVVLLHLLVPALARHGRRRARDLTFAAAGRDRAGRWPLGSRAGAGGGSAARHG